MDLRFEIQPTIKLSSVSQTLGVYLQVDEPNLASEEEKNYFS